MRKIFLSGLILLSVASVTVANIANPDLAKRKSIDTSLTINIDAKAKEARLIIPRSQLKQLRAELESLDGEDGTNPHVAATVGRVQTIVSGALLSLALIFGGLWFVRSGWKKNSKAVVATAVLLTGGSIATIVYGNAGPPPEARSITGKMFTQSVHMYKGGWGAIKLEVSDTARNPELIVPDTPKTAE